MVEHTSKPTPRSPNYPQQPLEWAVSSGLQLLQKEGLHAVPVDIVAKNLGYKDSNNGKARRVLANLKAFGIIQKAAGGKLAVSQDVQRYKLTPNGSDKIIYLKQWLKKPLLYSKLLDKYNEDLPSDPVLVFELVDEHGFNEAGAKNAIEVFRASLAYVDRAAGTLGTDDDQDNEGGGEAGDDAAEDDSASTTQTPPPPPPPGFQRSTATPPNYPLSEGVRYPVRLAGGRMAWIEVPDPFYLIDKKRMEAQLKIIGTDDEDNDLEDLEM